MDPITHNPNETESLVLTDNEFTSLHVIAPHRRETMSSIYNPSPEARAIGDESMTLHEKPIQSELHAVNQHTTTLQRRRTRRTKESSKICGGFHPIWRMPVETLTLIFEETLEDDECARLWKQDVLQATQLSHVCQHWRAVALNTPLLWSKVIVDFRDSLDFITEYWNRAVGRIRMTPLDVYFKNLGEEREPGSSIYKHRREQQKRLAACSFLRIPVIRKLEIEVDPTCPTPEAFSLITEFPTGDLELLRLNGERWEGERAWGWSAPLHPFPASKALVLEDLILVSFPGSRSFFPQSKPLSILQSLHVGLGTEFDIIQLLSLCPNLERLTMGHSRGRYIRYCPTPLTISSLTVLKVDHGIFPWNAPVHFPSLLSLVITSEYLSEGLFDFLANHPSISDLEVSAQSADLTRVATVAPQLINLFLFRIGDSLGPLLDWTSTSLQGPAFPLLETFGFTNFYLKQDYLDKFIQARCLPVTHPKSQLLNGCRPLRELVVPYRDVSKSRLVFEAKRVVYKDLNTCLTWL